MIVLALGSSFLILVIIWLSGPERIEVSANQPKNWVGPRGRWFAPRKIVTQSGTATTRIKLSRNTILGTINGKSASHLGILHGMTVVADRVKSSKKVELKSMDIVILKVDSKEANNPFRLCQIGEVTDKTIECLSADKTSNIVARSAVYGKVAFVQREPVMSAAVR